MDSTEFLTTAQEAAAARVAEPGDWLTGPQRVAVWAEVRDAATNPLDRTRREALTPNAVDGAHTACGGLPVAAVEVVHRVASDPGRLTRAWAQAAMAELARVATAEGTGPAAVPATPAGGAGAMDRTGAPLSLAAVPVAPAAGAGAMDRARVGEGIYTELVGITAICAVLDRYRLAVGLPERPLPPPQPGEPARGRPEDVGDVGAWVAQTLAKTRANVSRALSLVPATNDAWRQLVDSHYSRGMEFYSLTWDRPLSRPQVELVAARTTSLSECFY